MSRTTHISSGIMSRMRVFESSDSSSVAVTTTHCSEAFALDSPKRSPKLVPTPILTAIKAGAIPNVDQCDYSDTAEHSDSISQSGDATTMMMSSPPPGVQTDADGLILPKKLINPCLENTDRKQLHRELKFNNKIGKSVLNQKTELQRAYEKQRERQQQLQQQQQQDISPTSALKGELNRVILERTQKHDRPDSTAEDEADKQYVNPEYLNARAKLRHGQRTELK